MQKQIKSESEKINRLSCTLVGQGRGTYKGSYPALSQGYDSISGSELVFQLFAKLCKRLKHCRVVLSKARASGSGEYLSVYDEAHRITTRKEAKSRVKPSFTHFTPYLVKCNGKYKGKGIRLSELSRYAIAFPFDFESEKALRRAKAIIKQYRLPFHFDCEIPTGKRGFHALVVFDAYPLLTEGQREYYRNVWKSLIALLGADANSFKLTQLIRLPDTRHPVSGGIAKGYIRKEWQKGLKGKLGRIADRLEAIGKLIHTPKPRAEHTKADILGLRVLERLDKGSLSGTYLDFSKEFDVSENRISYAIRKLRKEGKVTIKSLRNKQRCGGVKLAKNVVNSIHSENENSRVYFLSQGVGYKAKCFQVLSEYEKKGAFEHYRVNTLLTSLLILRRMCYGIQKARERLRRCNLKSANPLSEKEFSKTVDSAYSGRYKGASVYWLNRCLQGFGVNSLGGKINQSDFALSDFKNENVINFTEARARKERQEKPKADFHFFDGKNANSTKTLKDAQGREIAKAFSSSGDVIYRVRGYYANSYRQHWYKWLYPSDKDYSEIHEFWEGQR